MNFPSKGNASVLVADGRELPPTRRTGRVCAAVMTPMAPVVIDLTLAGLPGDDVLFTIGAKRMRERFGIAFISSLYDAMLERSS